MMKEHTDTGRYAASNQYSDACYSARKCDKELNGIEMKCV